MALAAQLYRLDNRQSERVPVDVGATIRDSALRPIDASVTDLSETGFSARVEEALPIGAEISIGIAGIGKVPACIVRRDGHYYGARFLRPIGPAAIARAMAVETVVAFPGGGLSDDISTMPDADKYPAYVRIGATFGVSVLLWLAIVEGIHAALS